MREKFYGLLKEYLVATRERDLFQEQVRAAPEGTDREQVNRKLESIQKHCKALRREIRRYPDFNMPPSAGAPYNPPGRFSALAR